MWEPAVSTLSLSTITAAQQVSDRCIVRCLILLICLVGCQASCGGTHTMVLTAEGRIFGWGRGSFGRLGTGFDKDCHSPIEVFLPGTILLNFSDHGVNMEMLFCTCFCHVSNGKNCNIDHKYPRVLSVTKTMHILLCGL